MRLLRGQKRDIFYQNGRQHWAASCADANRLLSRGRNSGTKLFNGSAVLTESARDHWIRARNSYLTLFCREKAEISVGSTRWRIEREKERGHLVIRLVFHSTTLDKNIEIFFLSLSLSNKSSVLSERVLKMINVCCFDCSLLALHRDFFLNTRKRLHNYAERDTIAVKKK